MRKFIPTRESDNIAWLNHYASKLTTVGVTLGLTEAQVAAFQKLTQSLNVAVPVAADARAASKKANATKDGLRKDCNKMVSDLESIMQTSALYTESARKDLGTDSTAPAFDPATIKPKVVATLTGDGVRLRITKYGAKLAAVYTKLLSEANFAQLTITNGSVYIDKTQLRTPGIAEIRQYQVRIIVDNEETGYYSDIVTISFGG